MKVHELLGDFATAIAARGSAAPRPGSRPLDVGNKSVSGRKVDIPIRFPVSRCFVGIDDGAQQRPGKDSSRFCLSAVSSRAALASDARDWTRAIPANAVPARRTRMNEGISLEGRSLMTREGATNLILAAKRTKGVNSAQIAAVVKRHRVWTAAALLGQASMSEEGSDLLVGYLGLRTEIGATLQECPSRGSLDSPVPEIS
jgi:hypothetical protein